MYTAKVFIGKPQQQINAIWDTGSSKLLLETQLCSNCLALVYDTTISNKYKKLKPEEEAIVKYSDGTQLRGFYAYDDVCPTLDARSCAKKFKFIALTEQSGL